MLWMWISISVLTIMVMIVVGVVIKMRSNQKQVEAQLQDDYEPTEYIQVINENHNNYIVKVTQDLNHTHGVGLTVRDVVSSSLFHYTTFAMINDMPVAKCSTAIVSVLDELIAEKENESVES